MSNPKSVSSLKAHNDVHTTWTLGRAYLLKGCFTLWPKVNMLLISTNEIAGNQEFSLSTLQTKVKVQRSSQYKMILFEEADGLSKEVWVGWE